MAAAACGEPGLGASARAAAGVGVAAAASRPNAHWLYNRCVDAKKTMQSRLSPLEIAITVLKVLRAIENERSGVEYESDNECDYGPYYFRAFNSSGIQDASFVFDLASKTEELMDDGDLSEAELRTVARMAFDNE